MSEASSSAVARERRFLARAKINLYLHVLGQRADGMHRLDSLVVFADLGDTLAVAPAPALSLARDGPFADRLPDGDDNLVLRTARRLQQVGGVAGRGAALRLTKRLPVAAGIGGGSADAAATLVALTRLWQLALAPAALEEIAAGLGADLPVCLAGGPRRVAGIGDVLQPAPPLPPAHFVLVHPGPPLPTATVFRARYGESSGPADPMDAGIDAAALARALARRGNDLLPAAGRLLPEIHDVLAALKAAPGCLLARLSGSGATCFGLFADAAEAKAAAAALAAARPAWWVAAAPMLTADADPEIAA